MQLGEIGDLFHKLQEEIINYNDISFDKYYQCEIENINSQIKNHEDMVLINTKKTEIFSSALQNEEEFYLISKKLYENGSISRMEFLEKENYFKQQQQQQQQNRIELIKFKIILDDLKKKYKELYHESESKKQELSLGIKSLCQQILFVEKKWKQSYIITAPIDGELHYMASLQGNAQISEKQHLFTIIPKEKKYIAYAIINHEGQGKIRLGNEVYIKVLNFPYEEFGVLEGKVEGISRVYEDQGYKITISLGKELITNYNKKIDYKPEMLGQASIITEKLSILERVFYQFRRLFSR